MTVVVIPSTSREADHAGVSAAARWGTTDWIVPGNEDLAAGNLGLSGTPLNAAAITTSGLDVTIDTFEAYIGGAFVGSDDSTAAEHTHTLAGSSTTTTLYLGYDHSSSDSILFGPSSEFASADPKVPIVDATDDGSSVTDTDDRRPVGRSPPRGLLLDSTYDDDSSSALSLDTGTLSETFPEYEIVIYREDQGSGESYQKLRVNGSSSSNYHYDLYDAGNNSFTSVDNDTEFGSIAGTKAAEPTVYQVVRISLPREIVSTGNHYPVISIPQLGLGKNRDYPLQGNFRSDVSAVDQLNVFDGNNSTGWIEIYGRGAGHGAERWF